MINARDDNGLVHGVQKTYAESNEWVFVRTACDGRLWHHDYRLPRFTNAAITCFACLAGE